MKKKLLAGTVLSICLLSSGLSACSSEDKTEKPSSENQLQSDYMEVDGILTKTEKGSFSVHDGLMYFTDYETQTSIPVCGKPNCRHLSVYEDEKTTCNAVCSSSYMFPYKEKLYRIESVDNREGKLIASHMDGSNPKTVGTFSSGDMLESAVILNENMYYTYCELQNKILAEQEDGQAQSGQAMGSNCSLNRLNLDTLEQTEIVKLEDVSHILMLGGTKEYQVCAVVKDDGVQYNLFDYESGTLTEISLNTVDYQRVEVTQDGKLKSDVSDGVIFATEAEFTDLCIVFMLAVTVYFLVLDEKKNKLYPLLRSCYRGRGSVIGAKLTVAACVTALLVLLFYGVDYLYAWQKYGFGDLSRPIQSVTTMYESPYMMSVGMFLFLYLIVKMAVCYVIILGMIWIAQKSETPSGAMIGIGAVGIAEYMLSAFLPSVSYADVFKYVNLAEYMKVYPLFSKYHNLDFFDNPVNAMTVFRIVLPVVLVLFVLGNVRRFFRCAKTKRRWRRERKNSSRIGFISDKLYFYESVKCLFSNRAIWVCIAVMYGAVLVGNSIPTYRDIKEEYYKFYMTDQQGKMTEEKVEYFNEERKRFEEIYSMTPENSDLTAVEIVQKQEENKYAHEGFSEAYSQVMYIMSNNQGKGVNEQELVYEKGYQLLFGDKAVKERLIGILLCVIAAVYSASGVLGTEYDLKVMNLLRSTKRGRKELFLKKLGVSFGITAVIFVLVKIPAILKVVGEYPLECWGAKVRSMIFAGQSVINCSIFGYVLMLMIMQLVTLFVIVFSTMALSVVLKDSTMTMILSLLLFGGPLLIEWGGVPIVHYLSLNSLLDGHQILQGNWLVLISEIVIFWGALSFAAGYVLYRAYENRR